jgi:hypothetical protein
MVVEHYVGSVSVVALVRMIILRPMLAVEAAGGGDEGVDGVDSGVVAVGSARMAYDAAGESDDEAVEWSPR